MILPALATLFWEILILCRLIFAGNIEIRCHNFLEKKKLIYRNLIFQISNQTKSEKWNCSHLDLLRCGDFRSLFCCWTVIQHHQITYSRLTQQQKTYIGSIWLLYLEIFKWLSFSRCLSNVSWAISRMVGVLPKNVGLISKFSRFLIGMGQSSSCLSEEPELTGPTNNFVCRKRTSKSNWVLDQALDTFSCSFSCH